MEKLIVETFMDCARKLGKDLKPGALESLRTFIDTNDTEILNSAFRGNIKLCEVFVIRCYQDHLLPVSYFGRLLRHFIIKHGGGSFYVENDPLLFEMLDFAGFDELNLQEDKSFFLEQPDEITIYRGGFPKGGPELFWSMDKEYAMKYLVKGYHDFLWQAVLSKQHVFICKSKGNEIICNPKKFASKVVIGRLNESGVYCPIIPKSEIGDL